MNTEDLEKLYKQNQNDTAPDFWDRIDKELKPHDALSEEEKNAIAQFEELLSENTSAEPSSGHSGKAKRRHIGGWIAAAAAFIVCISAVLLSQRDGRGRAYLAAADTEVLTETAATAAAMEAAGAEAAIEAAADTAFDGVRAAEVSLPDTPVTAATLLCIPEDAVTEAADTEYFTEEVLADTDMLAIVEISDADFEYNKEGRAYRLSYSGTVKESLLDDSETGSVGSSIRIVSPIVSSGTPENGVLYQLVPGQTYILPLKKNAGDWELVCPYAPQIEMHEDGSFEFHTGYSSLLNDDTEVVFDISDSDDDFWFDRKVSRSDSGFIDELTELVRFEKKENPERSE